MSSLKCYLHVVQAQCIKGIAAEKAWNINYLNDEFRKYVCGLNEIEQKLSFLSKIFGKKAKAKQIVPMPTMEDLVFKMPADRNELPPRLLAWLDSIKKGVYHLPSDIEDSFWKKTPSRKLAEHILAVDLSNTDGFIRLSLEQYVALFGTKDCSSAIVQNIIGE